MKKIFLYLVCLSLFFHLHASEGWKKLAKEDLEYAANFFSNHYPAFYLPDLSDFPQAYQKALEKAHLKVEKVSSYNEYLSLLQEFIGFFKEPLITLSPHYQPALLSWPGFLVSYEKEGFYVSFVTNDKRAFSSLPPLGAQLIRCDKEVPEALIASRHLPYTPYEATAFAYQQLAPELFISAFEKNNPPIKECEFLYEGEKFFLPLTYKKESLSRLDGYRHKLFSKGPEGIGHKEFLEKGLWLSLPHYTPQNEREVKSVKAFQTALSSSPGKELVVLDLRGNDETDIRIPLQLFQSLYTRETLQFYQPIKNRKAFCLFKKDSPYVPSTSKPYLYFDIKTLFNLPPQQEEQWQLLKQLQVHSSPLDEIKKQPLAQKVQSSFHFPFKVLILADEKTGGASLLFLDLLLSMPNSVLLGSSTSFSSAFCQPVEKVLPSGLASMTCPVGVFVPFERNKNFVYPADYPMDKKERNVEDFVQRVYKELLESPLSDPN